MPQKLPDSMPLADLPRLPACLDPTLCFICLRMPSAGMLYGKIALIILELRS
jgi:hypothetical protein